jgi:hypothetical protein
MNMATIDDINNLVRAGNKAQAVTQLAGLIRSDLTNSSLWLLMADLVDDPSRKQDCFRRVLALDPGNQKAREFLDRFQQPQPPALSFIKSEPVLKTEPDIRPRQPLPIAPSYSPTHLDSHQSPPETARTLPSANFNPLEYQPSPTGKKTIKKYRIKWWLCLLFLMSIVYFLGILLFHPWITNNYIADIIYGFGRLATYLLFLFWFIRGIIGGIILSIKKLRGVGWIWVLFLLPIVLYLAFLALMGIFGEFAYAWGKNASYTRKKCPQCRSWIPREATRCQKCGQVLPVDGD